MSSHPSSAFKSGMNRVMGTVMGAIFGLAVTQVGPLVSFSYCLLIRGRPRLSPRRHTNTQQQWAPIHESSLIVLVLTLWVFICAFNRGSATYGEVAVSAALTVSVDG